MIVTLGPLRPPLSSGISQLATFDYLTVIHLLTMAQWHILDPEFAPRMPLPGMPVIRWFQIIIPSKYFMIGIAWGYLQEYPNQGTNHISPNSRFLEQSIAWLTHVYPFRAFLVYVVTPPIGHGLYTMAAPEANKKSVPIFWWLLFTPQNGWIY